MFTSRKPRRKAGISEGRRRQDAILDEWRRRLLETLPAEEREVLTMQTLWRLHLRFLEERSEPLALWLFKTRPPLQPLPKVARAAAERFNISHQEAMERLLTILRFYAGRDERALLAGLKLIEESRLADGQVRRQWRERPAAPPPDEVIWAAVLATGRRKNPALPYAIPLTIEEIVKGPFGLQWVFSLHPKEARQAVSRLTQQGRLERVPSKRTEMYVLVRTPATPAQRGRRLTTRDVVAGVLLAIFLLVAGARHQEIAATVKRHLQPAANPVSQLSLSEDCETLRQEIAAGRLTVPPSSLTWEEGYPIVHPSLVRDGCAAFNLPKEATWYALFRGLNKQGGAWPTTGKAVSRAKAVSGKTALEQGEIIILPLLQE